MGVVCQEYATAINVELVSLTFLYEKKELNLELSFQDQANSLDLKNSEMKIIVSKKEDDKFKCPKCGEKIKLNMEEIEDVISSNDDIIDNLIGTKLIIENIIKTSSIKLVMAQLKNINVILNTMNENLKKNNEILKDILNSKNIEDYKIISDNSKKSKGMLNINDIENKSVIKGVLDIELNEIKNGVYIFKSDDYYGIDFYLNNKKVNIIKSTYSKWIIDYNFTKEGKYDFLMVFHEPIIDMEGFFGICPHICSIDLSGFDSSNVNNMRILFNNCKKLKEIKGLGELNTKNVTDMEGMFQYCTELEYLDVTNLDTSNVNNMAYMFNQCNNLKEIKGLNEFKTNNVTDIKSMFQCCFELEIIDLSNFDTSNVTDMEYLFDECSKLKAIKGLNTLITSKVTTMEGMFQLCSVVKFVNISNFDTSNVTNMSYMFNKCKKLKEIKGFDKFNTYKVKGMYAMFQYCTELEYLNLSNFDTSNVNNMAFMFSQCNNIKEIKGLNNLIQF